LFRGIENNKIVEFLNLNDCYIEKYKKGTLIAQEGEVCRGVGIVLSGSVSVQQINPKGDVLVFNTIKENDVFGIAPFQSENPIYPFSFFTTKPSEVAYIPFDQIDILFEKIPLFKENYIFLLSKRIFNFKNKLQMLQHKDVRSRIIIYLSDVLKKEKTKSFNLHHSKTDIADIIGVARPSLSRELKQMEEDGLIKISGKNITIIKQEIFK